MKRMQYLKSALIGSASALALITPSAAEEFNIPEGTLAAALNSYMQQSGVHLVYLNDDVRGHTSHGAKGDYTETAALTQLLQGTGFTSLPVSSNAIGIMPVQKAPAAHPQVRVAAAAPAPAQAGVETVVVTAQHKKEDIQQVPIAVTALSQQQLTERQIAGGPDLIRDVPNMDFTKTNFTGYNIELRGIGTQAISVTTDPAVAVAFNDIPFIRNHFFEQEFYDLQDAEVLRGPQGTLYGRNATAGVVNIKSALPTDSYEAMMSADLGNYNNRRLEGMLNLPIVGDTLDLRIAGEWTKRDGYTINEDTGQNVDGRDLWSSRATLGWKPASNIQTYLVWEHFSEDDNRMRTAKQLCETAPVPTEIDGVPVPGNLHGPDAYNPDHYLSQGCEMTSLYSPNAFEVPNGITLPYYDSLGLFAPLQSDLSAGGMENFNPYASTTQSTNLRVIQTALNPIYRAKNDTLEFNADWTISPALTLTSQTGYNHDFLWSTEDYNRFDTAPGAFVYVPPSCPSGFNGGPYNCYGQILPDPAAGKNGVPANAGIFCDPQLGCSDRLVAEDLSDEHAWQISQEFRLASHYDGPINFSFGGNFLHYETVENYYVFINTLTLATAGWGPTGPWVPGVSTNAQCLQGGYQYSNPTASNMLGTEGGSPCQYIDPNPLGSLNNEGHNYFLSQNPYVLNSYAAFGELYYDITPALKATLGARWTEDQKHFLDIPSELLVAGYGYPVTGIVDQKWDAPTGRTVLDWSPKFDFTDQTLVYGSYSHGYKAGGANPPGAELLGFANGDVSTPIHPLTFKPEFIDAFELGTKNTLFDNSLTLNGDIFYYAYQNYQISEIVDRTAINNNYNASVKGAEFESNWEPLPGLKFGLTAGYEDATANNGDTGIDLMDRTAGNPNWIVVKPFPTQASNCILPTYVIAAMLESSQQGGAAPGGATGDSISGACAAAYSAGRDPLTNLPYMQNPAVAAGNVTIPAGYPGFNPATAPNNGEGFSKNLSDNQLPNAPHITTSLTAEYTMPVSEDWAATFHTDFYWQSQSWARIFNDPIDKLHGYSNVNLSLILNSSNGWQVMGYVKNVFNITAITGTFLNSDDSGLTTNVFLTDPRLFGVRVTKQLDQADGFWGGDYSGYEFFTNLFSDADNGKPTLWIELGGDLSLLDDGQQAFSAPFLADRPSIFKPSQPLETPPRWNIDEAAAVSFQPDDSDWVFSGSIRYGRSRSKGDLHQQTNPGKLLQYYYGYKSRFATHVLKTDIQTRKVAKFADTAHDINEQHTIMDFLAGKDVGLGMFGPDATSILSAGIRYAQFSSRTNIALKSDPDAHPKYLTFPGYPTAKGKRNDTFIVGGTYHSNAAVLNAKRSFHGIGPTLSWSASAPFAGDMKDGELSFDWGANAAVLFGRQKTRVHHQTTARYHQGAYAGYNYHSPRITLYQNVPPDRIRSRMVAVPNLGGFAGVSWKYQNAKVSFGYRADEFFGAIDGGIDTYKSENRGFFGPFANISIGIGG